MRGQIVVHGQSYPILSAELHLPVIEDIRYIYLTVAGGPLGEDDGFGLGDVELALLDSLDDLDGKSIHLTREGESFADDTLGTDIIGMGETSGWLCGWMVDGECYAYGEMRFDFERISEARYRCRVHCALREEDPNTAMPTGEDVLEASADFTVEVDEIDPLADSR
jgi:hypothetical protein